MKFLNHRKAWLCSYFFPFFCFDTDLSLHKFHFPIQDEQLEIICECHPLFPCQHVSGDVLGADYGPGPCPPIRRWQCCHESGKCHFSVKTKLWESDQISDFSFTEWAKLVCKCGIQYHNCGDLNWWPQCRQIGQKDCSPHILSCFYCWVSPLWPGPECHFTWCWCSTAWIGNRTSNHSKLMLPNRGERKCEWKLRQLK